MKETKIIKTIDFGLCPHCGKEIIISSKMTAPIIDWVLKKIDIENAKETVRKRISPLQIKDKKMILEWLNRDDTIIGPSDVEIILKQLLNKNDEIQN